MPKMGSHLVMDSPEPVRRVTPPSKVCMIIITTPVRSQYATHFFLRLLSTFAYLTAKVVDVGPFFVY